MTAVIGGRPVRVVALGLAWWAALEAWTLAPWGGAYDGTLAAVGSLACLAAVALFCVAWWRNSNRAARAGLWLTTGVMTWVAAVALQAGYWRSALLVTPLVVIAAGSAWLEEHDG